MFRVLSIVSLALAAVSAVSGHVIRRHKAPTGWETDILQNYDEYHKRYLDWGCKDQHNTTFFDTCCHPLLKGEPISAIENLGCSDGCEDNNSSVPPSYTSSALYQPAVASPSPSSSASSTPSTKPASAALAKGNDTPSPSPSPEHSTSTSAPSSSSTPHAPAQTSGSGSGNGGDVHSGGQGTFFFQKGVAGACGTVHQDSDFVCAIDSALYSSSICGKSVRITNTQNGKSVTVVVADECPTCSGPNSVDMSTGAYNQIGDESQGVLPIAWEFV